MLGSVKYLAALFVCGLMLALASANDAQAVATVQVQVTGQALGEVTLRVTDEQGQTVKEDEDSDRSGGLWWFRNKRPGTYTVQVLRNGTAVGTPQRVTVEDNKTSTFRANAGTGAVTVASAASPYMTPRFSVGLMGGINATPYDGSIQSTAGAFTDSGGLDDTFAAFGLEGRVYLSPSQQRASALGAGLFLTGTWLHYATGGLDRYFGNRHPGASNDVGAGIDPLWSFMFGIGKEMNIYQQTGLALMLGAHMTRAEVSALVDETGGGGSLIRASKTRNLFGPFAGAELSYGLSAFTMLPIQLFVQGRLLLQPDSDVSTSSAFTGWDYRAEVDGGLQFQGLAGIRATF